MKFWKLASFSCLIRPSGTSIKLPAGPPRRNPLLIFPSARQRNVPKYAGAYASGGKMRRGFLRGGPKEIRTPDLLHAMEARYQLCYGPKMRALLSSDFNEKEQIGQRVNSGFGLKE